jgi:hypothetical protein
MKVAVLWDQRLRLPLSEVLTRVDVSPHLRTETDPVSKTLCSSSNYLESGQWTKSKNLVSLSFYRILRSTCRCRTQLAP